MKRLSIQRALSVTVALLSLAEWIYLGLVTPAVRAIQTEFGTNPTDYDWPYPCIMSLHWAWCVPVGIVVATGIIMKDRWCSRRVAGIINLTVFLAGVALAVSWVWGMTPHRMSQTTQNTWQNKPTAPNPAIVSRFEFGHHRRGVGEPHR